MTADLQPIEQQIEQRSEVLREKLSQAAATAARRALTRPEVLRGSVAAATLTAGLVILDDAKAAEVVDQVARVIEAEKDIAAQVKLLREIPDAMVAAIRDTVEKQVRQLAEAKANGNKARVDYQVLLRQRAADQAAANEKAATAAAAAATRERAAIGDADEAPPPELAPVEVPRVIAGGVGRGGTQTRIDPMEIVDVAQVPVGLLEINTTIARATFLLDEKLGNVKRAKPGEYVTWKGIRFKTEEHAVNRR